ncbi:hypothetical protein EVAR_52870_1 [Eumeta japonica]|uniref:Secreted protein n=1 Tax=Eumeta variegata TaxID=151549 RepID=A0A4C1YM05_EUMVA|nr:hypothetical protein EVAR_52870_1 [Eumeta japonica]
MKKQGKGCWIHFSSYLCLSSLVINECCRSFESSTCGIRRRAVTHARAAGRYLYINNSSGDAANDTTAATYSGQFMNIIGGAIGGGDSARASAGAADNILRALIRRMRP